MNTSTIIVIIIVLVLLLGGGYYFLNQDGTDLLNLDSDTTMEDEDSMTEGDEMMKDDGDAMMEDDSMSTDEIMKETSGNGETMMEDEGAMMEEGSKMMEGDATVTYTDDGFAPSSVTVKVGQTVVWVNESGRSMWIASAFHPTHTVYPKKTSSDCMGSAFDACMGIESGDSWAFTFDEVGEWRYHDHLRAGKTGTVVVE